MDKYGDNDDDDDRNCKLKRDSSYRKTHLTINSILNICCLTKTKF